VLGRDICRTTVAGLRRVTGKQSFQGNEIGGGRRHG
jgi:hypothetical protein